MQTVIGPSGGVQTYRTSGIIGNGIGKPIIGNNNSTQMAAQGDLDPLFSPPTPDEYKHLQLDSSISKIRTSESM